MGAKTSRIVIDDSRLDVITEALHLGQLATDRAELH